MPNARVINGFIGRASVQREVAVMKVGESSQQLMTMGKKSVSVSTGMTNSPPAINMNPMMLSKKTSISCGYNAPRTLIKQLTFQGEVFRRAQMILKLQQI